MSDQDKFNPEQENVSLDDIQDADQLLGMIKREDGTQKYSDHVSALKGLAHLQSHLAKVEQENAQLREKTTKSAGVDEILEALRQPKASQHTSEDDEAEPEDINQVVQKTVSELLREAKEKEQAEQAELKRKANAENVVQVAREAFGDEASAKVYGTLEGLGYSREESNELMEKYPDLVLAKLNLTNPNKTTRTSGSVSTQSIKEDKETVSLSGAMRITSTQEATDRFRKALAAKRKAYS